MPSPPTRLCQTSATSPAVLSQKPPSAWSASHTWTRSPRLMGLAGGKVASLAKDLQIFPRNLSDPLGKFKFPSQPHDQCLVQPTCQLAVMENMNLRIIPQKTSKMWCETFWFFASQRLTNTSNKFHRIPWIHENIFYLPSIFPSPWMVSQVSSHVPRVGASPVDPSHPPWWQRCDAPWNPPERKPATLEALEAVFIGVGPRWIRFKTCFCFFLWRPFLIALKKFLYAYVLLFESCDRECQLWYWTCTWRTGSHVLGGYFTNGNF